MAIYTGNRKVVFYLGKDILYVYGNLLLKTYMGNGIPGCMFHISALFGWVTETLYVLLKPELITRHYGL